MQLEMVYEENPIKFGCGFSTCGGYQSHYPVEELIIRDGVQYVRCLYVITWTMD
jgi:hypothetical protein